MSLRKSLSRFREKMKDRLRIGDRREGRATSVGGEGSDRPSLSLRSEWNTVMEGEGRGEDSEAGGGEDNPVLRPGDSGSITRGRDPGRSDNHTDEGETDQKRLHVEVEGTSGREGRDQADTPPRSDVKNRTPTPPISRGGESKGVYTTLFWPLPLTDAAGDPVAPDYAHDNATTPKDEPGWISTTSSAAKLLLRAVERASDAFPPLKSVAGGLCAILDSCEVWSTLACSIICSIRGTHSSPRKQKSTKNR